jgi:transcriptional regulator with XRE-family HTH domain
VTTPDRQHLTGYVMRDYDNLIATLAASRESQGVSVREIARRMHGSTTYMYDVLHGRKQLGGSRVVALADALGYDLALVPREEA